LVSGFVAVVLVVQAPALSAAGEDERGYSAIRIGTPGVRTELGAEMRAHDRDAANQPDVDVTEGEIRKVSIADDQCRKAAFPINDAGAGGDELVVVI
jgi:hypothetical protein